MENHSNLEHSIQRLEHRLRELAAWKDRACLNISKGQFQASGTAEILPIKLGDFWPSRTFPVKLDFKLNVPKAWAGQPVMVRLAIGGEAKLCANGRLIGGLNPYHNEHLILKQAKGGEALHFELEAVPKGLFGTPNLEPRLEVAQLVWPDLELRAFLEDLAAAHAAAQHLLKVGRDEIASLIADAIEVAVSHLGLPRSPTANYLARINTEADTARMAASIWDEWKFEATALELPNTVRRQLPGRRRAFKTALEGIKRRYPPEGQLFVSGHAHIDLAWLWPFEETQRKIQRTFGTVLSLMERYPSFHFNQSSAQAYAFVEADDPDLFKRIQARVKEGRWDLVGGMWVEPDGNLLSGESWARQLLYGQRYFRSRFGQTVRVCWLPDTFGYTANLPQILRQGGIDSFFTTKLNWNETNTFPYDLYHWEGIDGSRVIAHSFLNPGQGYNGNIVASDLGGTWKNFKGKHQFETTLFSFGWGDGGGGPTQEMLERFERLKDFPGMPRLETGRVENLYQRMAKRVEAGMKLPVWTGEQYLELHRGTYSTQAKIKWYHRRLEHVLVEAEAANTLAWRLLKADYPQATLETAWTTLLRHHFHDVLPGSSVHAVNQTAHHDLGKTLDSAQTLRDDALRLLSSQVQPIDVKATANLVVWNLTLEDRPLRLRLPRPTPGPFVLVAPNGQTLPYQDHGDQIVLSSADLSVPGMGYLAIGVMPGTARRTANQTAGELKASASSLENEHLHVKVAPDGTLLSVFDKQAKREVLSGRGNQIWTYTDIPREWDAWEIDASYELDGLELLATRKPSLEQKGPLEASIRVERQFHGASIEQHYRLCSGSKRLEIETRIRWQGRRTLLRARFPFALRSHEAWFETAFGAIARPTHRNTSWDWARFEVNAHRWADLSEAGYGVSLLNDGKYGHSAHGNELGLTLLRSPVYPDPLADEGEHHFTYAIYPHQGDWRGETILEAHDLNAPLRACVVPESVGNWPAARSFMRVNQAGVRLSALKKAEDSDEILVRLYEAIGGRGTIRLETELANQTGKRVNFLEDGAQKIKSAKAGFELGVTPFSAIGLKLN
jgi:alpha-mannosidase